MQTCLLDSCSICQVTIKFLEHIRGLLFSCWFQIGCEGKIPVSECLLFPSAITQAPFCLPPNQTSTRRYLQAQMNCRALVVHSSRVVQQHLSCVALGDSDKQSPCTMIKEEEQDTHLKSKLTTSKHLHLDHVAFRRCMTITTTTTTSTRSTFIPVLTSHSIYFQRQPPQFSTDSEFRYIACAH